MTFDSVYESLLNGLAKDMTLQQIADKHNVDLSQIEDQLNLGIKVEMEHTGSKEMAKSIAMDHLVETPNYYTKIKKAGL